MDQDKIIAKYLPYLKEIQQKLLHVILVFFTAGAIGFIYYQKIIGLIMRIFKLDGVNIVLTSPYQFINLAVNCGLLIGLIFALPLLGYHLVHFLKPALKTREFRLLTRLYPISLVLFIIGFLFGAWIIQLVISLYTQVSQQFAIQNLWDIGNFFSQILSTGILMGLVFQMPIILFALLSLKIISLAGLKKSRKYVYTAILVFVALLPPNDIISLIVLSIPPLLLFELTLILYQSSSKQS
ncbi:MAG: twin-arginine translocase subunit TatC [Patescibacteria group bacterium]